MGGQGSAPKQGSMAGKQGSMAGKQGSMGARQGSLAGRQASMTPVPVKKAAPAPAAKRAAPVVTSGRFAVTADEANEWDINGASWAVNGGIFGQIGDVVWAREAEIKHGRICMLAVTGAIVQDLYTFPFMSEWFQGEKMWGLHDAAIKSGALWQVLWFIGLLEVPFLLQLRNGSIDGTGDIGFDPLGLKDSESYGRRQLTEVKNGRLAMIAISGMTHHYFLTGKGPIQFMTQIPNFKSCAAAAVDTGLCK